MKRSEILPTAAILVNAGGGTTSDCLSAAVYYILSHKKIYNKLQQEIDSSFKTESDIGLNSVTELKYLNACIEETLRIHPPVPGIFARRVESEGEMIDGYFVPHQVSFAASSMK
jgi:cytochrome P450